jgi:hypothetical protein
MTGAIEATLERLAADPDRFPGALLLCGSSEEALERESRHLAARLLCPGDDSDEECGSCRRVSAGLHPDFLSVEPEGVQIRVDRVREALVFGAGRPYEAARRVARILRADQLGVEGANALLKSLEEPGQRFRWILTSARPELLLPTIRSRCTVAVLAAPGPEVRRRVWTDRGFSEADAADLVLFCPDDDPDPAAHLAAARALRQTAVGALEEGLVGGRLAPLLLLAEACASLERDDARFLAELLADGAVAAQAPASEALRHRAVAGKLAEVARRAGPGAFADAAIAAADPPPDNRRGNRRLHYEKLLVGLWKDARRQA